MRRGALVISLLCAWTAPALARKPTANEKKLAREQFERGVRLSKQQRWEEALAAFTKAYALTEQASILLNLGASRVQTGRLVEASEAYRQFLLSASKKQKARHEKNVKRVLSELDDRVPRVLIRIVGKEKEDQLIVDGKPLSDAVIGSELPLDPGTHSIAVKREGAEVAGVEIALVEREVREVELAIEAKVAPEPPPPPVAAAPPVAPPIAPPSPIPVEEESSIADSALFWVLLAGAVIVAGAAATTGVVLAGREVEPEYRGNSGVLIEALGGER